MDIYPTPSGPLLPFEIITLILLCLPTESILRFKSVCKLWYQLITSDSHFIAAHLRRSPVQLVVHNPPTTSCLARISEGIFTIYLSLFSDTTETERTLGISYHGPRGSYGRLFTSCNGLLYFEPPYDCCGWVCNPILGEWVALPVSQNRRAGQVCGFFFNKASNEYRLLRVSLYQKSEPHYEFEILALGTKCWRRIQCSTSHPFDVRTSPLAYKNALHWPAMDGPHILVFHMDDEDIQLIDQPPGFTRYPRYLTPSNLMEMEGCLCLCRFHGPNMEIWILNDYYNVSVESWERKYVIRLGMRVHLAYLLNGEIVFAHFADGIAYYNPTLNSLRKVPHAIQGDINLFWLTVFKKSLVSLLNLDRTSTNRNISTVSVKDFLLDTRDYDNDGNDLDAYDNDGSDRDEETNH